MSNPNYITYEVLKEKDLENTILCISEVFSSSEPLTLALGITREEFYRFAEKVCIQAIKDGLSHIAKDVINDQVIGFRISEDLIQEHSEKVNSNFNDLLNFYPIIDLITQLENQYMSSKNIQKGEIIHLVMVGVRESYRNQNISKNLILANLQFAKEKKFKLAICETTGLISQHNARKLGFKEVLKILYKDYTYEGVKVFEHITPHTSCILMEKNL